MEKDWIIVFTTGQLYQAEIAKQVLFDNDIESIIINKKDSSYLSFGDIELYVNINDSEKALTLLNNLEIE